MSWSTLNLAIANCLVGLTFSQRNLIDIDFINTIHVEQKCFSLTEIFKHQCLDKNKIPSDANGDKDIFTNIFIC